jgi:cell division protein FtsL
MMPKKFRKTRNKRPSATKAQALFIVVCISFVIVSVSVVRELLRRHNISNEVEKLKAEITEIESQNNEFQSLITYLRSPTYTEQEGRIKLGLQKKGEHVIAIPGTNTATPIIGSASTLNDRVAQSKQGNPEKWWNHLFRNKIDIS